MSSVGSMNNVVPTCPYCGSPSRTVMEPPGGRGAGAMGALSREVERLREVAEGRSRSAQTETIEALTQEVRQLRETVARLRGSSLLGVRADPAQVAEGRR